MNKKIQVILIISIFCLLISAGCVDSEKVNKDVNSSGDQNKFNNSSDVNEENKGNKTLGKEAFEVSNLSLRGTRIFLGENMTKSITIKNNLKQEVNVDLSVLGGASKFLALETDKVKIDSESTKKISIDIIVPDNAQSISHSGILRAEATAYNYSILESFSVRVWEQAGESFSLNAEVLNSEVPENGQLTIKIELQYKNSNERISPKMSYAIENGTGKILKTVNETVAFNQSKSFVRNISLENLDLNSGRNYITCSALFEDNKLVRNMDTFEIVSSD